jgi:hypothetical protein
MTRRIIVLCTAVAVLVACGHGLPASTAELLINESDALKAWTPGYDVEAERLARPECRELVAHTSRQLVGFDNLVWKGKPPDDMRYEDLELTSQGSKYMGDFRGGMIGQHCTFYYAPQLPQITCSFALSLPKRVAVTGITDRSDAEVVAQFTFGFPDYPRELEKCIGARSGRGQATLRLQGDRWHVIEVRWATP